MSDDIARERYTSGAYLASNPTWDQEDSPWKARLVAQMPADAGLQPKSIADIGCGGGAVLRALRGAFPAARLVGFDIAPAASRFWPQHASANIDFRRGEFAAASAGESYDVILALDLIEHVADPAGFLAQIRDQASYFVFHFPLDLSAWTVLRETARAARQAIRSAHGAPPVQRGRPGHLRAASGRLAAGKQKASGGISRAPAHRFQARRPHLGSTDYAPAARLSRDARTDASGKDGAHRFGRHPGGNHRAGVPCITLRDNTERPVTVEQGTNTVVGTDPARILAVVDETLRSGGKRGRRPEQWDGRAGERIAAVLAERFADRS